MTAPNIAAADAVPDRPTSSQVGPPDGRDGNAADVPVEEPNLDELLNYHPVPFRRTVTVAVRYQPAGRMKPLPFPLHEAEAGDE